MSATATAPRIGRAAALPPDERRAAIIAAVIPLLREHGESVTCRQIAEAAGIAEGTIFRVFTDKDELLLAAFEEEIDLAPLEEAIRAIDPTLPFEQRLIEATALVQRRVVDIWELVSKLGPILHDRAKRPLDDSAALTEIFAREQHRLTTDAADAARMLRGLTFSLTHPMIAAEAKPADEIVSVFLHGIVRQVDRASGGEVTA
jgi:AcrR family transcriptional regulator